LPLLKFQPLYKWCAEGMNKDRQPLFTHKCYWGTWVHHWNIGDGMWRKTMLGTLCETKNTGRQLRKLTALTGNVHIWSKGKAISDYIFMINREISGVAWHILNIGASWKGVVKIVPWLFYRTQITSTIIECEEQEMGSGRFGKDTLLAPIRIRSSYFPVRKTKSG